MRIKRKNIEFIRKTRNAMKINLKLNNAETSKTSTPSSLY